MSCVCVGVRESAFRQNALVCERVRSDVYLCLYLLGSSTSGTLQNWARKGLSPKGTRSLAPQKAACAADSDKISAENNVYCVCVRAHTHTHTQYLFELGVSSGV